MATEAEITDVARTLETITVGVLLRDGGIEVGRESILVRLPEGGWTPDYLKEEILRKLREITRSSGLNRDLELVARGLIGTRVETRVASVGAVI